MSIVNKHKQFGIKKIFTELPGYTFEEKISSMATNNVAVRKSGSKIIKEGIRPENHLSCEFILSDYPNRKNRLTFPSVCT